ncbi:MAG: hypothetical protein LKE51_01985 [Selenomonas sp.]|jgi:hypothetical protein|nr:hypothetical protein [Selenomonas sp.]
MDKMKTKLVRYMDAGFPILYLNTFEEEKAEDVIRSVIGGKGIIEWSIRGFRDFKEDMQEIDWTLPDTRECIINCVSKKTAV